MNPYNVDTSKSNIDRPLISLNVLYSAMPSTSGCEQCQEVNGDDAIWCCKTINPSMHYVEFLKVWRVVQDSWSRQQKSALLVRAISNYLNLSSTKGCVFWDEKCLVYENRPFSCRMYGVIPEKSWESRIRSIKERDDNFEYRPQCDLVKSVDGKITDEQEDKWFEHIKQCEKDIGVPDHIIKLHDVPGGSYRTFHDHILLETFATPAMNKLTEVKMTKPSSDDIKRFTDTLIQQLMERGML